MAALKLLCILVACILPQLIAALADVVVNGVVPGPSLPTSELKILWIYLLTFTMQLTHLLVRNSFWESRFHYASKSGKHSRISIN